MADNLGYGELLSRFRGKRDPLGRRTSQMRMLAAILLVAAPVAPAAQVFRAGAYAVVVTPRAFPIITSGGFLAATAERAAGTLHIRALALDDGRTRAVIVVADTLMIPRELADRAKRKASERTGVPVVRLLVSATHTHSAPPLMGALGTDENPEYSRLFEERLVEAIEGAVKRLSPARLGWTVVKDSEHTHCLCGGRRLPRGPRWCKRRRGLPLH